jgi:hypothetical protein
VLLMPKQYGSIRDSERDIKDIARVMNGTEDGCVMDSAVSLITLLFHIADSG